MGNFLKLAGLILILCSCSTMKKINNRYQIDSSQIQLKVNLDEDSSKIMITMMNQMDIPVQLSSCACWGNTIPLLYSDSGELVYSIKVNVNPQCFERMIFLGPQQKHTVAFDYKLNEIYPNLKPGEYLLHFKYQGTIENLKGEEIDLTEPILSDRIRVSI